MLKVSIVIPVYQVEKFIAECIQSCINQTYANIEIILVNDGTRDSSFDICQKFADKDMRIKLFSKENGGLSDARNFGILKCTGDFIYFLDSDDWIHPECIKTLLDVQKETEAEIISLKITSKLDDIPKNKNINKEFLICDRKEALKIILSDNQWSTSACSKLFKTTLFSKIEFPKGRLYEDLGTIHKVFNDQKGMYVFIDGYGYYYRESENSITRSSFNSQQFDLLYYSDVVEKFIENNSKEILNIAKARKIRCILKIMTKLDVSEYEQHESYLEKYIRYLNKNIFIFLKSEYSIRHKIFAVFCWLSPKNSIKLLNLRKG